jgi:hypothetical protein
MQLAFRLENMGNAERRFYVTRGQKGFLDRIEWAAFIIGAAISSCREIETPMAGKNSLREDLYADGGGFDAERSAGFAPGSVVCAFHEIAVS